MSSTRESLISMRDSARYFASAFLGYCVIVLGLQLLNLYVRRKSIAKVKLVRQTVLSLLGMNVLAIIYLSLNVYGYTVIFPLNSAECNNMIRVGWIGVYLFVKQFIYAFLFVRMKVTHSALGLNSLINRLTRWTVFLNVLFGIPFVFLPLGIVFYGGSVSPEGFCIQYHKERWPVIFFVVADTLLNITVTFLFVVPILQTTARIKDPGNESLMKTMQVARVNLGVCLVMSSITLASLIHQAVHGDISNSEDERIFTQILASVDLLVAHVCCHSLTFIWLPFKVPKLWGPSSKESSTGSPKGATTSLKDRQIAVVASNASHDREPATSVS